MNTVQYAEITSSGALASSIGWIDFGQGVQLSNLTSFMRVTNLIPGGYTISFDLTFQASSTAATTDTVYTAVPTATSQNAPFGNVDYKGIGGNTALFGTANVPQSNPVTVMMTLNNISIVDCKGCPVNDYLFVVADAAYTNVSPSLQTSIWSVSSRSANWNELQPIPAVNGAQEGGPRVEGLGTYTVTQTGLNTAPEATMSYIYISKSPREVMVSATIGGANAGFSFGVIVLSDTCQAIKYVGQDTINYVEANKFWSQQIMLPEGFQITDVIYGEAPYVAGFGPIIIEGWLAVYVIIGNEMFIATYPELISQTYDFIILVAKRGEAMVALPVLFEYIGNQPCITPPFIK